MKLEYLRKHYREQILALAEKYKAEEVRIFGSVARGDARPESDVDILVKFKVGASLLDESGLNRSLENILGVHVDLLGDDAIHPAFRRHILSESVAL